MLCSECFCLEEVGASGGGCGKRGDGEGERGACVAGAMMG